ncbi:MAG: tetratricopeptide repeat protein [Thermodesulfobacteriota bacterium]
METQIKRTHNHSFLSRSRILRLCLLVILIGVIYLNSLDNLFTNWDDSMIYSNYQIRSLDWENIRKIFTYVKGSTYQPVRVLSYAVDYYFWGLNPLGYHITNIIFYILTSIMVFFILHRLSTHLRGNAPPDSHERIALFGALLFAAHPVHVEAVTWLAARKEGLQGFFFFLAFYLYLKGREEEGRKKFLYLTLVLFSFLLATLSKPAAIVFPAILLLYEISLKKNKSIRTDHGWIDFVRRHWFFIIFSVFISFIFTYILMRVMLDAGGIKPYRGGTFFNNLLISFYVFLYNIKLLISTINYSASYTIPISNPILGVRTLSFIGITFLLFGLSLWSLKKTKIIFFSFFFFFITLLPYLNIVPISTLLADRYVFIASFSYCFLLGICFDQFYRFRNKRFSENFFKLLSIALFLFVLVGYSSMTLRQNQIWENSYTLWADAVEKYPDSNTANALMGVVYMELGMDEKAVGYLEKAIQVLPYDYQSRNNLGIVCGRLEQPEKALKELMTAIWLKPEDDSIKINLSVFYQRQKEYQKAVEVLRYLLLKNNHDANLHFRLGLVYKEMGQYDAAISELVKAMELAPQIINPYEELGNIYLSKVKDIEKAKFYYTKGIEAVPKAKARVDDLRWMIQDLECHR